MKTLTCVGLPDKKSASIIRKITEELSEKCNSQGALEFQPHFTIRGDFKIQESQIPQFNSEIQNFCTTLEPLRLILSRYDFYPWRIIFLDIDKDSNLQRLHNGCMEIIEKYRTPWIPEKYQNNCNFVGKQKQYALKYGYHFCFEFFSPHFTVAGNDMSEACFQKIKKVLKNKQEKIQVKIDQLAFFDRDANNRVFRKVALGKKK